MVDPVIFVLCLIGPIVFCLGFVMGNNDRAYEVGLTGAVWSVAMCLIVGVLGMLNMIFG